MKEKQGYWRCRKHKKNCQSYVKGIVDDLNEGLAIDEEFMHLVEFVNPDGHPRKMNCLVCGREMYECWDNIAKEYTGYIWRCICTPPNLKLGVL